MSLVAARAGSPPERIGEAGEWRPPARPLALDLEARRRALEHRIELAKERLVADLTRAKTLLRDAATQARRGVMRAVWLAGAFAVFGVLTLAMRRRARRGRLAWRR